MVRKITASLIVIVFATVYLMNPSFASINQELYGRVIILDAGHGEENPNVWEDYFEHIRMLDLAFMLKPLLEARGAEVFLTRADAHDVPHAVRCSMINNLALGTLRDAGQGDIRELDRLMGVMQRVIDDPEQYAEIYYNTPFDYTYEREIHPDLERIFGLQADPLVSDRFLIISLHSNATPKPIDTSRNGVDIYYMSNDLEKNMNYYANYSNVRKSFYFARLLMDDIGRLGLERQEIKDYYYFMLREHNLPAVLVENGFHTNDEDRAKLMDDVFLSRLATVYAEAVLYYFASMSAIPERTNFDDIFGRL